MAQTDIATVNGAFSNILERLLDIQKKYSLAAIQPNLNACRAIVEAHETIDVGVFGRFKAGKSSLLNYFAGTSVLPIGVTPVTAVITRLRYGPSERAIIEYNDGRSEVFFLESVESFVSESHNPGNAKNVSSVVVELPSLKSYPGLQFIDTPGLESVFQHNTEMALSWLPNAGLALVTISVDPPLSKHDIALIRKLFDHTPKIIILLTKADLVTEGERSEIAEFIGTQLLKEFGFGFRIFPFSVRPGYGHLQDALDREVLSPLTENRHSSYLEIVRFKFNSLLDRAREYLSLASAAANRLDSDRSKLKAQILNEKTSYESIRIQLQALATECASRTRPWIMKRMEELKHDVERRITEELQERLTGIRANLWKLSRAYEDWLHQTIKREMQEISSREADLFVAPLETARETLARAVQGFRDRLAINIEQALGMRFSSEPFAIEIEKPAAPDIAISNLFMFNTDLLWFVIPMWLFRSWANRHFIKMIPYETEKNLSRLASQWTEGINAAILKMQRDAEKSVREQIHTIESQLERTQSDSEEIRKALSETELLKNTISLESGMPDRN
jgi:GTP-binding protein EngB required for normal cell division